MFDSYYNPGQWVSRGATHRKFLQKFTFHMVVVGGLRLRG
jgi:hypothetical protein